MSNELARRMPAPAPSMALSRVGRQAIRDYNDARLEQHRAELSAVLEKAKARLRKELAMDTMNNAQEVDSYARALSAGRESIAMTMGDIVAAYNAGELARVVRRAYED